MNIQKICVVFFSPTGGVEKAARIVAGELACLYAQEGQAAKGREWFGRLLENPLAVRIRTWSAKKSNITSIRTNMAN